MNLTLHSSPWFEPDKKMPFSEFAVMLMKSKLEIDPSVELVCLGQVVTYIGSALPHQDGS